MNKDRDLLPAELFLKDLAIGHVISIHGIPGFFKVAEIEHNRIKLLNCDEQGNLNDFNNSVGEYWIRGN